MGGEDEDTERPFDTCDHCGAPFEPEVSYPVECCRNPDGELELYSFCDEECRRAWADDEPDQ